MAAPVRLYHIPPSFYSQLARLTLAEKGVAYRTTLIAPGPPLFETYAPWYMRLNPNGSVPTLVHEGAEPKTVPDSREILTYVDATFDGPELRPADPDARAQVDARVAELYAISFRNLTYGSPQMATTGARVNGLRIRNLRRRHARHPDLAEVYAAKIRDIESMIRDTADEATVTAARAQVQTSLDTLDAELADGRAYLVGASYSLADIVWTVGLARMHMLELDPLAGRPQLAAWYGRMRERPSFVGADVWERMERAKLAKMIARKLGPHVLVVLALLAGLLYLVLRWVF